MVASWVFLALGALIAVANLSGVVAAIRRQRRGIDEGYSSIPAISAIFCTVAWFLDRGTIGLWAFLPALVDPGTWSIVVLPFFLLGRYLSDDRDT